MRDQQPRPFPPTNPGQTGWRSGSWTNLELTPFLDEFDRTWNFRFCRFARQWEMTRHRQHLAEPHQALARGEQPAPMDLNVHEDLNLWNDDWERGVQPDIDFHNMGEVMHIVDPNWEMRWEGGDRPLQDHIGEVDEDDGDPETVFRPLPPPEFFFDMMRQLQD